MILSWLWDVLPPQVAASVLAASFALAFAVWAVYFVPSSHSRIRWLAIPLIALGGASNHIVIFANGGYMPVAGRSEAEGLWIPADDPTFPWLIDRLGPASIGDVLLGLGLVLFVAIIISKAVSSKGVAR